MIIYYINNILKPSHFVGEDQLVEKTSAIADANDLLRFAEKAR